MMLRHMPPRGAPQAAPDGPPKPNAPHAPQPAPAPACLHELEGGQRRAKLAALLQVARAHVVGPKRQAHLCLGVVLHGVAMRLGQTGIDREVVLQALRVCCVAFEQCSVHPQGSQPRPTPAPPSLTGCHATMMRLMASTLLVSPKLDTPGGQGRGGGAGRQRVGTCAALL